MLRRFCLIVLVALAPKLAFAACTIPPVATKGVTGFQEVVISVGDLDGPRGAQPLAQAEPASPPAPAAKPRRTSQASSDAAPGFTLN